MFNHRASSGLVPSPTLAQTGCAIQVAMSIGNSIRALRKERNLSQSELAAAIGWERSTVATIESGHSRPGTELVEALATFFQVSTDRILGRQGTEQMAAAQTDEEAELLTRFRDASPSGQAVILATIREITRARL